jgi:hypothetical protein
MSSIYNQKENDTSYVYWLRDETCIDPQVHGYVGVTLKRQFKRRMRDHRYRRFKCRFYTTILFEGERSECFHIETILRPEKGIGWNRAIGGRDGYRFGFIHTKETKQKLSSIAKGRPGWNKGRKGVYSDETKKKMSAAKKGKPSPRKGTKNRPHSEETKKKISCALKGHASWSKGKTWKKRKSGQIPWNKGTKGHIPWNKNKKKCLLRRSTKKNGRSQKRSYSLE